MNIGDIVRSDTMDLRGTTVAVVGAGLSGLFAAHELSRLGATVRVFESSHRIGGRLFTDHFSADPARYVDFGAARIVPQTLPGELYRRLGIPVENFIMRNPDAMWIRQTGSVRTPVRLRTAHRDNEVWRQRAALPADSGEKFRSPHGMHWDAPALADFRHAGIPVAETTESDISSVTEYLASNLRELDRIDNTYVKTHVLVRPVGGSQVLTDRLAQQLPDGSVSTGHSIVGAELARYGVVLRILTADGSPMRAAFDHAIFTPMPHQLERMNLPLPSDVVEVLRSAEPRPAVKVAALYPRRWWESDYGVYGGTSYPNTLFTRVWYPSDDLISDSSGVLVGYAEGDSASTLSAMTPDERRTCFDRTISELHPRHGATAVEYRQIVWSDVAGVGAGWVRWPGSDAELFQTLDMTDSRLILAGDWADPQGAWQSSAITSASRAVGRVLNR
ncbi:MULTISPECIES: flavin monoamine oxidase family protein [Nocardia]|uniref:flavin monoamine oxidase family protein n=1 Tax=Nocardia TaxID=1817 RepID=UPI000D68A11E|nr:MULTISPECIES: FAD-dependent oxidoreductase [Nocardia]